MVKGSLVWNWVGGSQSFNEPGIYGNLGVPNVTNIPYSRTTNGWYDKKNSSFLWFFGGRNNMVPSMNLSLYF